MLSVAQIVDRTEAEGPGSRFAVWLQGCPLRCAGCCNPEMLPFDGGEQMDPEALAERALAVADVEGVTLLGGEPFAHAAGAATFCEAVSRGGKSVMVFTGFTLEALRERGDRDVDRLIAAADILVDGPYDRGSPEHRRRWIGSANQRMHFLSTRYDPRDPVFCSPNTVEIRLTRGELTVNGWPAAARALRREPRS